MLHFSGGVLWSKKRHTVCSPYYKTINSNTLAEALTTCLTHFGDKCIGVQLDKCSDDSKDFEVCGGPKTYLKTAANYWPYYSRGRCVYKPLNLTGLFYSE